MAWSEFEQLPQAAQGELLSLMDAWLRGRDQSKGGWVSRSRAPRVTVPRREQPLSRDLLRGWSGLCGCPLLLQEPAEVSKEGP